MWIYKQLYHLVHSKQILLLPFFIIAFGSAQINTVSEIQIQGNDVTKEYIIQREIQHPITVPLDTSIANEDQDRIDNLGIFSHVSWEYIQVDSTSGILKYFVIESWRYLPGIIPIYTEEYGWIFSGGLIINNFRGRNQTASIGGEFGGRTSYGFDYHDPWIAGDHISFFAGIGNNFWTHPYLNIDVTTRNISIAFGRYFGYKIKTQLEFELVEQSLSDGSLYQTAAIEFVPNYDTRDLYSNPTNGILISHVLRPEIDITGMQKHHFYWIQSYSIFHNLNNHKRKLVACANVSGLFLFGDDTHSFFSQYIGGAETIRGYESPDSTVFVNDPDRFGTNRLISSVELRQTIIPRYATSYGTEFGLSAVGYIDVGVAGNNMNELLQREPLFGVGIGLRVPIAILQTLRFDYGVGYRNGKWTKPVFHFAIGHKF